MTVMAKPQKFKLSELVQRLRFDLAFFHWVKRYLPRGLYGRVMLILVLPVLIAQGVATYVFYERHWQTVTNRLAFALAGEIALIANEMEQGDPQTVLNSLRGSSDRYLNFDMTYHQGRDLDRYMARGD